jgi:hypothetical protein
VAGLSGVAAVAVATDAPPHNMVMLGAMEVEGRPSESLPDVDASWVHVTSPYFRVMRIPHVEGGCCPTVTDRTAKWSSAGRLPDGTGRTIGGRPAVSCASRQGFGSMEAGRRGRR